MLGPKRTPMIHIDTAEIPSFIPYLHKLIVEGHGDHYRETDLRVFTKVIPCATDQSHFPYLKDVEEVWVVYSRGLNR